MHENFSVGATRGLPGVIQRRTSTCQLALHKGPLAAYDGFVAAHEGFLAALEGVLAVHEGVLAPLARSPLAGGPLRASRGARR